MKKKLRVFFFGDSICFGQGISIHKGWVSKISKELEKLAKSKHAEITVINAGVNGNTTRLALERMPYDVQTHSPDILLIQFGMNDCNYWDSDCGLPRVSRPAFSANLKEIVQRGKQFGAKKIFLNTNHPTTRTDMVFPAAGLTYEQSNMAYNEVIRELAEELSPQVVLNDVEAKFQKAVLDGKINLADSLLSDSLHLSEVGHSMYYNLVGSRIKMAAEELLG